MPVDHPYPRTCRQFVGGQFGGFLYTSHANFAQSPEHYVRAFLILLKDLHELFDYVEPADKNLSCYSYRIHALLLRACVEVEANCKAILKENGYSKSGEWNMGDYKKIEKTHLLSGYEIKLPNWSGTRATTLPFATWASGGPLPWYQAYNTTKHDRHAQFEEATFEHLIDACCGLLVVLSAQFGTNDFSPTDTYLRWARDDGLENGIGDYFRVRFPTNWPAESRYDFDWGKLKNEADPFRTIDYSRIT
jgi:hypothetical protein